MKNTKHIMYLRKSSESEERQELSIPAQRKEVQRLCERKEITLHSSKFEEAQSAKKPGRPLFNDMMELIHRGEATGIVCWKLDRLARNPLDGGAIIWALGEGVITEIVTIDRTYTGTADDKMLMSIMFGMATKYSDDLSANVKRGNREALERGLWPGRPPIGYLRDPTTRELVEDPERFDKVKELWKLVLRGVPPLDALRISRTELQLRTRRSKRHGGAFLAKSRLYLLLHDPFFAGIMRRGGETYVGSHPPMITMAEFDRVQQLLRRGTTTDKSKKLFFAYRGLIRCGSCDSKLTAKHITKKNGKRYTYYHCWRKERRYKFCPEPAIQQHDVEEQLRSFIEALRPPDNFIRGLRSHIARARKSSKIRQDEIMADASRAVARTDASLSKLRELLVENVITREEYAADRLRLTSDRQRSLNIIDAADQDQDYLKPIESAVDLLNTALFKFDEGDDRARRTIVEALTCNLAVRDKKVLISAKKTLAAMGEWSRFPLVSAWVDHVETEAQRIDDGDSGGPCTQVHND